MNPNNLHADDHIEVATFAGGCFWSIEAAFDDLDGVIEAVSGYAGGTKTNPTYDEVKQFLAEEKATSAWEVNNNAEANGIRAAFVYIDLASGWGYWKVAFETIDNGLIFIDPVSHKEINVEIGKRYCEINGFFPPACDDTITKVTIAW